jgi:hypothetical protein
MGEIFETDSHTPIFQGDFNGDERECATQLTHKERIFYGNMAKDSKGENSNGDTKTVEGKNSFDLMANKGSLKSQPKMGEMGQKFSPGGSVYKGPIITEVAKTISAAQTASRNPEKALVTWKRKYGDDDAKLEAKKRKGNGEENRQVEKGRKLSGNSISNHGSGKAEAAGQPRRPQ